MCDMLHVVTTRVHGRTCSCWVPAACGSLPHDDTATYLPLSDTRTPVMMFWYCPAPTGPAKSKMGVADGTRKTVTRDWPAGT